MSPLQQKPKHLGAILHTLRADAGLTRRQLGFLTRLSEEELRRIELGKTRPTRAQLEQLVVAPGLAGPLAWLGLTVLAAVTGVGIELAPAQPPPEPSPADGGPLGDG